MKIISLLPNVKYEFVEHSGGSKELKVEISIKDIKILAQKDKTIVDLVNWIEI
jgi:hypothetical protein